MNTQSVVFMSDVYSYSSTNSKIGVQSSAKYIVYLDTSHMNKLRANEALRIQDRSQDEPPVAKSIDRSLSGDEY